MKRSRTSAMGSDAKRRIYVFLAWHVVAYDDGHDDSRCIGVFSSERKAREAIRKLRNKPGFRSYRRGFSTARYVLDLVHWAEGYGGRRLMELIRRADRDSGRRRTTVR